ncbi:imidazole glycerol phosphate synthase subunit HisH [Methanothermococcus sp. SCGC AD-155-E23]|nr:imidazole glycerol phosphate synthase subunit HisH [Methanothermococcus sp. SCGC AD-155-E23]
MIVVVDYNAGNLRSIVKALEIYAGRENVKISRDPEEILSGDKIVFPGVGNFKSAVVNLSRRYYGISLREALLESIENKVPFLGICLGMHLLMESSEEGGDLEGLGVVEGKVIRFRGVDKIPHMGWNNVELLRDTPLFEGVGNKQYFYFVHSYHVKPLDDSVVVGVSEYGYRFPCVIQRDNIYGTQFHPEKSSKIGLKLIENFLELI